MFGAAKDPITGVPLVQEQVAASLQRARLDNPGFGTLGPLHAEGGKPPRLAGSGRAVTCPGHGPHTIGRSSSGDDVVGGVVMGGNDRGRVVVATFPHAWEAELARSYLADSGIEAWVDPAGLDDPYRMTDGGMGLVRLFATADRVAEARVILAEIEPEPEPAAAGEPASRRPRWVVLVAALLLGGFAVIAVPYSLRLPVAVIGLAGYYMAWRRRRPPD